MIVDDEPDVTFALKLGLELNGFRVDTYNNPSEALTSINGRKNYYYDLAIFDVNMPGMNGFELYRQVRKWGNDMGVCFLTAFEVYKEEFEKVFPDVHVVAFLKKPMPIAAMVKRLNELVGDAHKNGEHDRIIDVSSSVR